MTPSPESSRQQLTPKALSDLIDTSYEILYDQLVSSYEILYDQLVSSYIMHPAEWNINKTDRKTQQAIAQSLKEFGPLQPLIIEPHPTIENEYRILGGNHRWLEMQGDIRCNIMIGLTESKAKKLSLSLNVHGSPDKDLLLAMLTEFYEEEGAEAAAVGIPYSTEDIERMMNEDVPPIPPTDEEEWEKLILDFPQEIYKVLMRAVKKTGIQGKNESKQIVKALELICVEYLYSLDATTIDSNP